MNTYLKYQPPAIQFLSFLMLAAGFFLIDYLISSFFLGDVRGILLQKDAVITPDIIRQFKWTQTTSAIISFIFPALLFGYFSSPKALPYVGLQKTISPVILIASIVLLLSIQPFVSWLGELNAHVNFGSLQKELKEQEALYNRVLGIFLQMKTPADLVLNLFVMALLPAIGEELFFRGALQRALMRLSNKPWLAIAITAVVFALLHGTFFKILPIFVLGLMLCIVYHVTRNLWYTIIIHFVNNAIAVLSVYYSGESEFLKKMADDTVSYPAYTAIASGIIAVGLIFFIKRKSDEVFPAFMTNEDNDYIA